MTQPFAQLLECGSVHVVVGPEAAALRANDAGVAEHLEVMGDGRLGEIEERDELADADLTCMPSQDVDELHANRVAQRLGDGGGPLRLLAGDLRVHHRLATGLAGGPLLLGGQLEIDGHLYVYID